MSRVWCALVLLLALATSARAQPAVGFQAGGTVDPEQFFAGVFWQSPEIGGRVSIRPGLDGGFGSDLRIATINVDFVFLFPLNNTGWALVQGGGPSIVISRFTAFDSTETDVGGGASYILGFAHEKGFFTEVRVGSGRAPSVKFGAGWRIEF